jgi:hypothetical protein
MAAPTDARPGPRERAFLALALGATAVWFGFLAHQVWRYANPVVVSRPQLLVAPLVVEGRLLDGPARVVVERVWWGADRFDVLGKELAIEEAKFPAHAAGELWIVPVAPTRRESSFRVQPIPLPGVERDVPDIYPATDAVRRQVEQLLTERKRLEGDPHASQ